MKRCSLWLIESLVILTLPILASAQTCPNPQKIGSDLRVSNNAVDPSLSWTGSEFGVSWAGIYFTRISATGVKQGSDVQISGGNFPSGGWRSMDTLVWTGGEFGVSWVGGDEIYFARVSSTGAKLGSDLRISNDANPSYYPSLSWAGSEFGVSWNDWQDIYDPYEPPTPNIDFARIGCGGNCNLTALDIIPVTSLPGGTITLAEGAQQTFTATCTYTGSSCGVTSDNCAQAGGVNWNYAGQVSLSTLGPSTSTVATAGQIPGPNGGSGQVSGSATYGTGSFSDSTNITVTNDDTISSVLLTPVGPLNQQTGSTVNFYCVGAWSDGATNSELNPKGTAPVYSLPFNGSGGNINSSTGLYTAGATAPSTDAARCTISTLFDGTTVQVSSAGSSTCPNPAKLGSDLRVTNAANNSNYPTLAWTGSEFGTSWGDNRDGNYEIYFARVSSSGDKIGTDVRITNYNNSNQAPELAWTGSEFGLSWSDHREGDWEIYFARVSAAGVKIDTDVRITYAAGDSWLNSLVWTGSEFAAGWEDSRAGYRSYFARISATGTKIGNDLQISDAEGRGPQMAWSGSEYGITFPSSRDGNNEIYFARVSSSGAKIGSDVRITYDPNNGSGPSPTWTGSEFGVTWMDDREGNWEVYFVRVSADGVKQGSDVRITTAAGYSGGSHLAWTGFEYGLGWYDNSDGNYEIYFVRLSAVGAKLGSILRVTNASGDGTDPSLVWTASEYGLDWNDNRDGNNEIYFARIGCPNLDTDGDGMPDWWETQHGFNPLVNDASGDADGDGLTNLQEYQAGTNPHNPDTDGDMMPDWWEASHGLNPLVNDASGDADGDGLSNLDEYYNGSDPKSQEPHGRPGIGFFGDADGSLSIGGPDLDQVALVLSGNEPSYSQVYPAMQMVQDFDGSGTIGGPDLDYLQLMLSGNVVSPFGWPTDLSKVLPVGVPSIQVGHTVAIKVKLTTLGGLERPGFGVVFSVSQGSATLLGGEGWAVDYPAGSRYDLTDANGEARMAVKVGAAVTIKVHVEMPAADPGHDLMSGAAVALPSEVEITGIP